MPRSAARESQQPAEGDSLLSTLVQASPLAIYLLDPDGVVQLWNPAAERIFGWSEHAVLGQRDPTVASADHELDLLIQTVLSSTEPVEREVVRFNRWAEPIEIALSATRVLDAAGQVRGIMAIAADITERRRIERERDHLLDCERDARERAEAAEARARFLAQGSALLDGSLDYLATLNNLARLAVPYLADYCLIDELEDDCVSRVAVAHVDPEREQLLQREAREPLSGSPEKHPVLRVMLTGKSVLMEEVDEAALGDISHDEEHLARLRQLDLHSYLVVPLETGGRILGAVTLAYAQSRRRYSPADMAMAEELARRAANAVEAARV